MAMFALVRELQEIILKFTFMTAIFKKIVGKN